MISLQTLCEKISLQPEVAAQVLLCAQQTNWKRLSDPLSGLFIRAQWDSSLAALKQLLGDDPKGIKVLTCMLSCGCESYQHYIKQGISESIFIDTFRCFPRFIAEHNVSYGYDAFDRDWWTAHQISLALFRIGTLEYEMTTHQNEPVISIHIPSDAILTREALQQSYLDAQSFFTAHYPSYVQARYMCHSWMIDPVLNELLPDTSKIRAFGASFSIDYVKHGAKDFIEWIFKNPKLDLIDLPETTSLQRATKAHLLQGGQIGEALGWLNPHGF